MTDPMTPERLAEIREREQAATPGPWEPGNVWLIAGLIYDDGGNRVDPETATRCGFCHLGEPAWSGRRPINGPIMNAHRHRNPEPWSVENLISAANGDLVAGNFDYEEGGIIAPADTVFVAAAREDVPALLAEVERLRAELAETTHALAVTGEKVEALRGQRDRAEAERNTALAELNGAYRGAEELRSMLRDRTAERDQARAELAKRPKSRLGEQVNRLSNAVGDLERERDDALGERDQAREQVKALADEWEATITSGVMSGQEWEQCLRANLPRLRAALDGTEPGQ